MKFEFASIEGLIDFESIAVTLLAVSSKFNTALNMSG